MTLRGDVIKALKGWVLDEFGNDLGNAAVNAIGFAYSQYEGHGDGYFVDEQWYANVDSLRIWLELDGIDANGEEFTWPEAIVYEFADEEEMVEFIECMTFDGLIGEADGFIEDHEVRR